MVLFLTTRFPSDSIHFPLFLSFHSVNYVSDFQISFSSSDTFTNSQICISNSFRHIHLCSKGNSNLVCSELSSSPTQLSPVICLLFQLINITHQTIPMTTKNISDSFSIYPLPYLFCQFFTSWIHFFLHSVFIS